MPASSNLALIYDDIAGRAVLSGGSWQAGSLRLSNVQTPYLPEVARSTSAAPSASRFDVDFGSYATVGGIALGGCQVTPFARFRLRAWSDTPSGTPIYDTGIIDAPGMQVDRGTLEWEDPGFWEGLSVEYFDNSKGALLLHLPPSPVVARTWRIEIIDPTNPFNNIDVGRLIMGKAWQASINYGYEGNALDFEALTDVEEGLSGTRFYNPRNLRRSFSFGFDYLPEREVFEEIFRIVVKSGMHNQVVVINNPMDLTNFQRDTYIGSLSMLPSLRRTAFQAAATNFKIDEVL